MDEISKSPDSEPQRSAFMEAVERAGSQGKLAAICGCTAPNIWQLIRRNRPLPAEYVLRVEAATGVDRRRLRPDLYPMEDGLPRSSLVSASER